MDRASAMHLVAATKRPNAGQQFGKIERFLQIVVGSQIQTAHPILRRIARCQHQNEREIAPSAQLFAYLPTAHSRKHNVQQNQRIRLRFRHLQGCLPVSCNIYLIVCIFQAQSNRIGNVRLVFHQ